MGATRKMAVIAVTVTVLGLMALPATGSDTITFTGTAQVCAESPDTPKPKAAACPQGKPNGLYEPGGDVLHRLDQTDPSKWMDRHGNWSFVTDTCSKVNPMSDTGPVPCSIHASGKLGPVGGLLGAACGVSRGFAGTGTYRAANGTDVELTNIGWETSAGGTLPVTADYSGFKKDGKPSTGQFVGIVTAAGGIPCLKSDLSGKAGASQFAVVGVFQQLP